MQQKLTVIELTDDFDGTPGATTVPFTFDGVQYEIELSDTNRNELDDMLAPYIERARRVGGRRKAPAKAKPDSAKVRAWAAKNGVEVSPNGRVPRSVIEQYEATQGK